MKKILERAGFVLAIFIALGIALGANSLYESDGYKTVFSDGVGMIPTAVGLILIAAFTILAVYLMFNKHPIWGAIVFLLSLLLLPLYPQINDAGAYAYSKGDQALTNVTIDQDVSGTREGVDVQHNILPEVGNPGKCYDCTRGKCIVFFDGEYQFRVTFKESGKVEWFDIPPTGTDAFPLGKEWRSSLPKVSGNPKFGGIIYQLYRKDGSKTPYMPYTARKSVTAQKMCTKIYAPTTKGTIEGTRGDGFNGGFYN